MLLARPAGSMRIPPSFSPDNPFAGGTEARRVRRGPAQATRQRQA